ncbi:MAG: AMP-binding protein [Candidatus Eisenbacteria bacterium]|jgi:long-chain acyl-CoA synthetase|nr:AMP-binding protein [Candidatus Eisenbacteria bacterium]
MYRLSSFTLREVIVNSAAHYGDKPAVGFVGGEGTSYRALGAAAAKLAITLRERGYQAGDRIALLSENRPEWVVAYFGITAAGFVGVPILTDFGTEQIANILAHSEAKAIIVSEKLRAKLGPASPTALAIEDLLVPHGGPDPDPASVFTPVGESSLAVILYTSGTTGNSKGVVMTHKNLVWDAWATRTIIKQHRNDRVLSILPLAHAYECTIGMLGPILQGPSIWYLDRPPVASVLIPAMEAIRPTIMLTVPIIIEKTYRASVKPSLEKVALYKHPLFRKLLCRMAGKKLMRKFGGKLRFFGIGGAALAADVEQFLKDAKFPYAIGYGLTETAPLLAGSHPSKTVLRSTGPAMKGVDLRIADPDPHTNEGEIQAKGPNVMPGYYKDPVRTAEAFTPDGWFKTGDLGYFDTLGNLYIRGRSKTMILSATGENIYPEEIESLLNAHHYVADSLVYGDGNGVAALVHLKPEAIETLEAAMADQLDDAGELLEAIRKEINPRLAAFSRIGKIQIQKEPFEKTPNQKIKRFLYPSKSAKVPPETAQDRGRTV